jgi:molecular chaperone GrpE
MTTDTTQETTPPGSSDPATDPAPAQNPAEAGSVDQLQAELDRFKDLAMRNAADLENYRKRATREKEDAIRFANAAFLERLIPILDNFELGLGAARNDAGAASIVAGLDMVARQLQDFLVACGVEPVNPEPGTPFDPNLHEAIGQEAHPEIPDGSVVRQLRKGFKLRERLLRPATVVVSKGPA